DPSKKPNDVASEMAQVAERAHGIEVTHAIRDATIDGTHLHKGEAMALLDGKVVAHGDDEVSTLCEAAPRLTETEVFTLYIGPGQLMTGVELLDPADSTATNVRATWFGRQFIKERYPEGQLVRLSGKVKWFGRTLQFANPKIESASAEAVHTGRIVPVYALTDGLKEGHLRRWLHTAVFGGAKRTAVVR